MKILIVPGGKDSTISVVHLSQAPQIGDEIMIFNGDKSATYTVWNRRWAPTTLINGRQQWEEYLVLEVIKKL